MYGELIQRLRETSMDFGETDHVSVMLLEAAEAIEGLEKACEEAYNKGLLEGGIAQRAEDEKWLPKWIPVAERLPEDKTWVLAHYNSFVAVSGCFNHQWCERRTYVDTSPTHWMPLPAPPKEKT